MQLCPSCFEAGSGTDATFTSQSTLLFVVILPPVVAYPYVTENANSFHLIHCFFKTKKKPFKGLVRIHYESFSIFFFFRFL